MSVCQDPHKCVKKQRIGLKQGRSLKSKFRNLVSRKKVSYQLSQSRRNITPEYSVESKRTHSGRLMDFPGTVKSFFALRCEFCHFFLSLSALSFYHFGRVWSFFRFPLRIHKVCVSYKHKNLPFGSQTNLLASAFLPFPTMFIAVSRRRNIFYTKKIGEDILFFRAFSHRP